VYISKSGYTTFLKDLYIGLSLLEIYPIYIREREREREREITNKGRTGEGAERRALSSISLEDPAV